MFSTYPPIPHTENSIEVIDSDDRPFVLMPRAEVLRQGLSHRGVVVAVRSNRGRILISKRPADTGSEILWGLSAYARIRAGESRVDAALRALMQAAGMQAQVVYGAAKAPVLPARNAFDLQHITLFVADIATDPSSTAPNQDPDRMLLDKDELQGMNTHFPEMLSPALRWAVSSGALFATTRT